MSDSAKRGLIVYRENKPFVRRALGAGQVDYLDLASGQGRGTGRNALQGTMART